ncbi:hypothetical protein ILT44_05440 [Microvirga sp. BT689]|uniref:hypothetical protein n=1 Tax=Microvirga arvi TaxID=2778731 RepID=UPI00195297B3|nr:hypothetical protein [Microvirga arvi]MBM6579618.1 hypothetical protein [Microvirga arvi]
MALRPVESSRHPEGTAWTRCASVLERWGRQVGDHQIRPRRFTSIVHHTDAEREWAYGYQSHIGRLDKAWDKPTATGRTLFDMKRD